MSEKKRRKWTAKEKLWIVLTCMQPGVEVSEVCRREGINPDMFYNLKKKLLASASQVFEKKPKKRSVEWEYGFSTVMSTGPVTQQIKDEQTVLVDGTAECVYRDSSDS